MPEAIIKQDGTEKNAVNAMPPSAFSLQTSPGSPAPQADLSPEDSLSSNAPHIRTFIAHDCHYMLRVKEGDHGYLFAQVVAAKQAGKVRCMIAMIPRAGYAIGFASSVTCHSMRPMPTFG